MPIKIIQALRNAARSIRRILNVQMPMGEIYGLRTRWKPETVTGAAEHQRSKRR
jgi:hypothetical protein